MRVLRNFSKFYAWSFIGTIIGLIALAFYLNDKNRSTRQITVVIENVTNLVKPRPRGLKIAVTIDGQNLSSDQHSVVLARVRIKNTGGSTILQGYYDTQKPLIIESPHARVFSPQIVKLSNDYLREAIPESLEHSHNRIFFPKVILEPQDEIVYEAIYVQEKVGSDQFSVRIQSKIGGTAIVYERLRPQTENISGQAFSGSFFIQILRMISYGLALIVTFGSTTVISLWGRGVLEKAIKEKRKKKLRVAFPKDEDSLIHDYLFARYIKKGAKPFKKFLKQLQEEEFVMESIFFQYGFKSMEEAIEFYSKEPRPTISPEEFRGKVPPVPIIIQAIQKKLILLTENGISIDRDLKRRAKLISEL